METRFKKNAQPKRNCGRLCIFDYSDLGGKRKLVENRSDFNIAVAGACTGDFKIAVALTKLVEDRKSVV